MSSPTPPQLDANLLQAYLALQAMLRQELQPLRDDLTELKTEMRTRFAHADDIYARKDTTELRFKPLEEAALTRNQRMGVFISAGFGLVATIINIISFIVHLPK